MSIAYTCEPVREFSVETEHSKAARVSILKDREGFQSFCPDDEVEAVRNFQPTREHQDDGSIDNRSPNRVMFRDDSRIT